MESIAWLIAFIVFVVIEILTFQLVTVWFAVGSVAAMIGAIAGISVEAQLSLFLIVSFLLLLTVRPLAGRYIKGNVTKTNADSLIGMTARVTSQINNKEGFGAAIVRGQEWTAVSELENEIIPVGTEVTIVRIVGVKLIVKKKEEKAC